jgi:hypothetical protein
VVRHGGGFFERATVFEVALMPVARNVWLSIFVPMALMGGYWIGDVGGRVPSKWFLNR